LVTERSAGTFVITSGRDNAIYAAGSVIVDDAPVLRLTSTGIDHLGGQAVVAARHIAPGPGGDVCLLDDAHHALMLFTAGGVSSTSYDAPFGLELIGSMADGRPVIRNLDKRSYVIEPSGAHSLLSGGAGRLLASNPAPTPCFTADRETVIAMRASAAWSRSRSCVRVVDLSWCSPDSWRA
jgi:hypothetical protein